MKNWHRFTASVLTIFLLTATAEAAEAKRYRPARGQKKQARKAGSNKVAACRKITPEVGILAVTENGEVLVDQLSGNEFNPASVSKIVTAYGAIKRFGLQHRFVTTVFLDGELDGRTGTLNGDIYVAGCDPDFERKDAIELAETLNQAGIRKVSGNLFVSPGFSLCSAPDSAWSARTLAKLWSAKGINRLTVAKGASVRRLPEQVVACADYTSEPLHETLKEMLSYSQNAVAEQLGRAAGGVKAVCEIVAQESGLPAGSLKLATASGLGRGRVKPRDIIKVMLALRSELKTAGLDLPDIFPLAGIDPGTLDERFTDPAERGSVVAKTGSLPGTDGGTSTLAGVFRAGNEDVYFAIFCWRGNVCSFRHQQDRIIRELQSMRGGPAAFDQRVSASL